MTGQKQANNHMQSLEVEETGKLQEMAANSEIVDIRQNPMESPRTVWGAVSVTSSHCQVQ